MQRIVPPSLLFLLCMTLLASAQETPSKPAEVDPDAVQGLLIRKVAPVYPPLARQARIQGTVVLNIVINKSGEVSDLKLFSGHPMLAPAAVQAVKQWRYRPYEKDGEPVEIQTTVQVNFKIADNPPTGVAGDAPGIPQPAQTLTGQVHVCEPTDSGSQPTRVRVSAGVMRTLILSKAQPEYPADAKDAHIEGTVLLDVEISRSGSVCDIALISGHPLLAPAAVDAVRQWTYRPYLLNGQPVEVETQVQVHFQLLK